MQNAEAATEHRFVPHITLVPLAQRLHLPDLTFLESAITLMSATKRSELASRQDNRHPRGGLEHSP